MTTIQLDPKFTSKEVAKLDAEVKWSRAALDGQEYMPGLVGLNNMKANDYANVVVQVLTRIQPIRNFFLEPDNYKSVSSSSLMVLRTGELIRKIWNTRNFKGQVSPHEFMQAVMLCSDKRFLIEKRSDPVEFFAWLLNTLHHDLTGGKVKKGSVITQCFQGELEVVTEKGTGKGRALTATEDLVDRVPFFLLALDLPPPLYSRTPWRRTSSLRSLSFRS